jgi:DNA-directed RNA polymerase subunit RPC12/RpoP
MRLLDFHCNKCGHEFEEIIMPGQSPQCQACRSLDVMRTITCPKMYIMRTNGASTSPKRFNNYEERRKEGKRERVTGMMEKQGLNEKNNTKFGKAKGR